MNRLNSNSQPLSEEKPVVDNSPETPADPTMASVVGSISLNIAASVGTIFINKHLFQNLGFIGLGTTLTVFHFVFCFGFTAIAAMLGVFQPKKLPIVKVLPISLAFCGYVVFNNISLAYNSVSFYQVMKIMCTPTIIAIEYFFYRKSQDKRILYTLIPVCLGTFITVFTDMEMNYYGTFMAILAVVSNSLYTIYGTEKQKELKANSLQVLLYQSITSAVMLAFTIPFFDDTEVISEYDWGNGNNLFWIISSCFTAFFVNFSFFLVAGKTSPLSVNVVGYFKTVLVFAGGILLFTSAISFKNLLGVFLTLLGVAWYSYVKYKMSQESSSVLPTTNK